jgi:hypothetical protein
MIDRLIFRGSDVSKLVDHNAKKLCVSYCHFLFKAVYIARVRDIQTPKEAKLPLLFPVTEIPSQDP